MLISYNWIKSYFKEAIPEPKKLADIITMGAFEIDGMEEKNANGANGTAGGNSASDTILDIKVLPDRSAYALSHRYIAQEIGALIGQQIVVPEIGELDVDQSVEKLEVLNEAGVTSADVPFCIRYAGRIVRDIVVDDSPTWLKNQLEVLGQRSISSIVDLTNYVMLETGQPLHAFDADKVKGAIRVRLAKEGEEITLLDGTVLKLSPSMLVIADDEAPLALAGIKGGKKAEVTRDTENIILEAACFNSTTTRKTSQQVSIKNDSSKRFENGVTPERAGLALALLSAKIHELNPGAKFGEVADVYENANSNNKKNASTIVISVAYISERLGLKISKETVMDILSRIDIAVTESDSESTSTPENDTLIVSVPAYRPDLNIAEDIIEEIGRINGYEKIKGHTPAVESKRRINKNFYYHNVIRKALVDLGFSEVYTYTLTDAGDTKLANPLTVERAYLRNNLSKLIAEKALFNLKNVDLLGLKDVRMFEIGKVFGSGALSERFSLALTIARSKLPKGHDAKLELEAIGEYVLTALGIGSGEGVTEESLIKIAEVIPTFTELQGDAQTPCAGLVIEFDLDTLIARLPEITADTEMNALPQIKFTPISSYPFSVRDIAVFVPGERGQEATVESVIVEALSSISKADLLVRKTLFDVFTKNKEGEPVRTSYAFRLVFQSQEKTLGEEEISECMNSVNEAFKKEGWEVR